jgi:hypothetical protein
MNMKALPFLIVCFTSLAFAEDFKTIDGQEYKDATVSRVEPDGIVLTTGSGIAKIYFVELPRDVQERFHYDSVKAAAFAAEQNAQLESVRKQREEARQKQTEEMERQSESKSRQQAEIEQQGQLLEEQREVRPRRASELNGARSTEGVPEHNYELLQDHTIRIRGGMNGASIRLKRGERYRGRILADHAEIDMRGISYWVPSNILLPVRD